MVQSSAALSGSSDFCLDNPGIDYRTARGELLAHVNEIRIPKTVTRGSQSLTDVELIARRDWRADAITRSRA